MIERDILPELTRWRPRATNWRRHARSAARIGSVFILARGAHWTRSGVLDRYELLYEQD